MTLIEDWKKIALHSWSSRLAWLAAALSSLEVLMPALQGVIPADLVQPGTFALFALIVSASAGVARLISQPSLTAEPAHANDANPA